MLVDVKLKKMFKDVITPVYAKPGDSGMDIRAYLPGGSVDIYPQSTYLIPTGIMVSIPEDAEIQVRPKSGKSLNTQLFIKNSPGTIDSSYRGEIGIICKNNSADSPDIEINNARKITIKHNEKIAQICLCPILKINFIEVENLDETERGSGGFGHTGTI